MRGVIAALALVTAVGSYYASWIRRHLGRLFRTCIYLLVLWFTGLLILNQFAWSYALGLAFLYAASGLAFGIGLRRIEPLLGFLAVGAIAPIGAAFWVSSPAASPVLLTLILGALGIMTAVVTDWRITFENELEAQQERYERLYREYETIFESADDSVILVEPEDDAGESFSILRLNSAHESRIGRDTEEARGRSPREVLGEEVGGAVQEYLGRCVARKESVECELQRTTDSGPRFWQIRLTPIIEGDRATKIVGIARDVTEQHHRKQKLLERELLLEHIRQRAEEVIWVTTPEKNEMEFISEAYAEIWGRSTEKLRERPTSFVEAIHPDDRDRVKAAIEDQQRDPENYEEIYRVLTPDDDVRWVRDRAAGVYDEEGELIRVVGIATDITAERRRDEQLRLLDRIIQHDLRHDVSHAQGWGDMLSRGADPQRASEQIQAATGRIIELLNSADALQRALRSGHELELEPVLLRPHLEQAVNTVKRRLPDATISLDARALESLYVRANRLLGSVFENLIANGVRHNDQDSPVVEVEVERATDRVQVIVADDGPGIPTDQREQIFEERNRGLESEGMGLGLYLVRTLSNHYDARIDVIENQPRGTRFIVELDVVRQRGESDSRSLHSKTPLSAS